MAKKSNNKPIEKLKAGPISATVWQNDEIPVVVFERSYKDKNGKWASSNRFSIHDLPILAWLSKLVFQKIQNRK